MDGKIYPRSGDKETVYLKNVVSGANIEIGDYTIYNDFVHDPRDFERSNVLYHYPVNGDRLKIGKFCSIACGAKFLFTSGNHSLRSLSTYTFPIFFEEWGLDAKDICSAWDNKGDIVIGSDVWIGYEALILRRDCRRRRDNRQPRRGDEGRAALYHRRRRPGKAHTPPL